MIPYQKSFIGVALLFRVHGSPLCRAGIPGLLSVVILLLLKHFWMLDEYEGNFDHPYGIGVLISSVSFLIIFRANYGYQRYWNACSDVHQMMSKWQDAGVQTGVYHMQSSHYDCIKPPNYYDNHDLNKLGLSRDREKADDFFSGSRRDQLMFRKRRGTIKSITCKTPSPDCSPASVGSDTSLQSFANDESGLIDNSKFLINEGRLDGGWGSLFGDYTSTFHPLGSDPKDWKKGYTKGFASTHGGRTPSLFLQELVHLISLLNAVAFSTLRNDVEGAPSPLDMYHPGSKFPKADPDKHLRETERWTTLRYLFGFDRTSESRTRYNASRPLPVLGGVSENEIKFLQRAKGPSAKVALAHGWLSEFIVREDLAGSLGEVGAPIISRVMQFLSDGMVSYNHCRKTMFIPFPFPHAQLSVFFNVTMIAAVPLLMIEYSHRLWLDALLTFATVVCLSGLHEVSRELENPFRNIPNDIPLDTLQSMFNESLITIYAGYHPDHYWDGNEYRVKAGESPVSVKKSSYRRRSTLSPSKVNESSEILSPLSSSRLKSALLPVNENDSNDISSSERNIEILSNALDREKTIFELQKLVKKQSDEIDRLSESGESSSSPRYPWDS